MQTFFSYSSAKVKAGSEVGLQCCLSNGQKDGKSYQAKFQESQWTDGVDKNTQNNKTLSLSLKIGRLMNDHLRALLFDFLEIKQNFKEIKQNKGFKGSKCHIIL